MLADDEHNCGGMDAVERDECDLMRQELSAERPAYEEQQHKVEGGYRPSSPRIIVTTVEVGDSPCKATHITV